MLADLTETQRERVRAMGHAEAKAAIKDAEWRLFGTDMSFALTYWAFQGLLEKRGVLEELARSKGGASASELGKEIEALSATIDRNLRWLNAIVNREAFGE